MFFNLNNKLSVSMTCRRSFRRLIVGLTAVCIVALFRSSAAISDIVQLREVDGGQNYYSQFSYPLPSDNSFFPLGVWIESVVDSNADLDKEVGLNLYVALTADSNLSIVAKNGMRTILQQSEWRANKAVNNNPVAAGWELADEI